MNYKRVRVHYRDVREVMRSGGDLQWKDMTTIPGITPSTSCSTTGWCMCAQFHRHSLYQDSHQIIPYTIHLLLSTEKTYKYTPHVNTGNGYIIHMYTRSLSLVSHCQCCHVTRVHKVLLSSFENLYYLIQFNLIGHTNKIYP